ncbi:ZZ-type zinc finger-containing protein 3 [Entophlyctis luteolus]|nr:ZZ-type zinc finger-containing protein 3 [Entophlyctis luteolus]
MLQRLSADIDLVAATLTSLEHQLMQNSMDIEVLKKQKQHALDHPKEFVSMLVAKKITFPRLQQILAIPEIDMDQYEERNNKCLEVEASHGSAGAKTSCPGIRRKKSQSDTERTELFKSIHHSIFPPVVDVTRTEKTKSNPLEDNLPINKRSQWTNEEKQKLAELLIKYPPESTAAARATKISLELTTRTPTQIANRISKFSLIGTTSTKLAQTTSGSSYIGNHVVRMAESDSDESEEDVDPEAKNSEEYSELMRLKALAKIRELEKTGSIEKLESIHHETHKINHDFEKVVEPEDSSPSEQ